MVLKFSVMCDPPLTGALFVRSMNYHSVNCIEKKSLGNIGNTVTSWSVVKITILVLAITGITGFAVYKYRIRVRLFICIFDVDVFLLIIE